LTEAYARVTTLQTELDRNDAVLRARQADTDALRAELAAANAARHELEMRLIRAREDVASELAVLASTMIKMKDDALARADARIAMLTAESEALRAQRSTAGGTGTSIAGIPATKAPAQIPSYIPPQATSAGWAPGNIAPDAAAVSAAAPTQSSAQGATQASTQSSGQSSTQAPTQDAQRDLPDMAKAVTAMSESSETSSIGVDKEDTQNASENVTVPGLDPLTDANNQSEQA
jgi:uncharacterized small protein (DUF1192 family)